LVWKSGLDSWIVAGEVSGLFTELFQFHDGPAEIDRSPGEDSERGEYKGSFRERARSNKKFRPDVFLPLVVFGLLAIHESMILSQHQISYQSHGLAVVNA